MDAARALERVAPRQLTLDFSPHHCRLQAPSGTDEVFGRGVGDEPFDDRVGWQSFQDLHGPIDVGRLIEKCHIASQNLIAQRCAVYGVERMEFDGIDLQTGDFVGGSHDLGT